MATKSPEEKARAQARTAAFNLIPPAHIEAAEDFGSTATKYAAALQQVHELEEQFRAVTEHAHANGWDREQLDALLQELPLPVTPALPRTRKTRKTRKTTPTAPSGSETHTAPDTDTRAPEPAPVTTSHEPEPESARPPYSM